jgi:predicted MFS family arabinose efflux permease
VLGSSYGTIPLGAGAFGLVAALTGSHGHHVSTLVFIIDAATFAVSFLAIAGLRNLDRIDQRAAERRAAEGSDEDEVRFLDAVRLPIIRAVAAPTIVIALGLGTLFSVGITFVRDVLHATDTQFGWLVAMFGVGAGIGLVLLHELDKDDVTAVRVAVAAQGLTIAGMSFAPTTALALIGAVLFGAATAAALAAAMSVVQERLDDRLRVMAFAVFHTMIRFGLAIAALGAGLAVDMLRSVHWPLFGHLPGARLVLLIAGAVVFVSVLVVRVPDELRQPR